MPPLIHITDLYHPPQDPDDHVDLATIYALPELDLRAVILDASQRFLDGKGGEDYPRDPGFVAVAQLNYITGRSVPAAVGPMQPLRSAGDDAADRPRREQAGVELILRTLRESDESVFISVVGSTRALMAAFNREPQLLRQKVRSVLLNAGSTGKFIEWNVELDPAAYIGLWRSGLPIDWFPCATNTGPFDQDEHNTFWRAPHRELFKSLPRPLRAWFAHAFCGNLRGDIIRALDEQGVHVIWEHVLAGERNLWSIASLALAAGRELGQTPDGWRFVAQGAHAGRPRQELARQPVNVKIDDNAVTTWSPVSGQSSTRLFERKPGPEHTAAMTEALAALLGSIPL